MDDLYKKLEELCKSLLSLKGDQQKDVFVAKLKLPGQSSFKLKAPSVSAVPKIPGGLPPPSKKDPVKVAQQLKNPQPKKVQMEVLKVEDNGQWTLEKDDKAANSALGSTNIAQTRPGSISGAHRQSNKNIEAAVPVDAKVHGWTPYHRPDQQHLIHGLKLHEAKPLRKGAGAAAIASSEHHPNTSIVKKASDDPYAHRNGHQEHGNFNAAKREVLFHNLARDLFGMQNHVPTTAGFTKNGEDWSAQQEIKNASHPHIVKENDKETLENPNHTKIIQRLNDQGSLDKLALMDLIMGNHDRHGGNYLLDDTGDNMHLIDHGGAFDYDNFYGHGLPHYHKYLANNSDLTSKESHDNDKLHPAAKEWLGELRPEEAKRILAQNGYDENHFATKGLLKRLSGLQEKLHSKELDKPGNTVHNIMRGVGNIRN